MSRRKFILIILLSIIVGALTGRKFHTVGLVISITAMIIYLMVDLPKIIRYIRNFKKLDAPRKLRMGMWVGLLILIVVAILEGSVYYFMLLGVLGMDFVITEKQSEK